MRSVQKIKHWVQQTHISIHYKINHNGNLLLVDASRFFPLGDAYNE
jgi:hypothetical protein